MKTVPPRAQMALRHELRPIERDCALKMTRSLPAIPKEVQTVLCGVRRTDREIRLAGRLPEVCLTLIKKGAPLADVLALPLAIERMCVQEYVKTHGITPEAAVQEETTMQYQSDTQEFRYLAHPNDERVRADAIEAAQTHKIALDVLIATLDRKPIHA